MLRLFVTIRRFAFGWAERTNVFAQARRFHTTQKCLNDATTATGDGDDGSLVQIGDIIPQKLRKVVTQHDIGIKRQLRTGRIAFTHGGSDEQEGTIGASSLVSIDTSAIDECLPTAATLVQTFSGIPFTHLPIVHVCATYNNTKVTVIDPTSNKPILYTSASKEGFKNAKKKSPLAGQTVGAATGQKLLRRGVNTVRVVVKGIGPGRMTATKGMASVGINVVAITDFTHLPELGPRPRRMRRV